MVVVVRGDRRGDADLLRPGGAGGEKIARPAHRLDRLMVSRRSADRGDLRPLRFRAFDLDDGLVQPGRDRPRAGDPGHRQFLRKRMQQRTPAGRKFGDADDPDRAEDRRRVRHAPHCFLDQVGGPHHRTRKPFADCLFKSGDRSDARMIARPRLEVDSGTPGLAQRARGGVDHPGKLLDRVEFAQLDFGQGFLDRFAEELVIDRSSETRRPAGKRGTRTSGSGRPCRRPRAASILRSCLTSRPCATIVCRMVIRNAPSGPASKFSRRSTIRRRDNKVGPNRAPGGSS